MQGLGGGFANIKAIALVLQPLGKLAVHIKQHFRVFASGGMHRVKSLGKRDLRPYGQAFL